MAPVTIRIVVLPPFESTFFGVHLSPKNPCLRKLSSNIFSKFHPHIAQHGGHDVMIFRHFFVFEWKNCYFCEYGCPGKVQEVARKASSTCTALRLTTSENTRERTYMFVFPEDSNTGFPYVYQLENDEVLRSRFSRPLDIIGLFVKRVTGNPCRTIYCPRASLRVCKTASPPLFHKARRCFSGRLAGCRMPGVRCS